jgi:hypothetical protein
MSELWLLGANFTPIPTYLEASSGLNQVVQIKCEEILVASLFVSLFAKND